MGAPILELKNIVVDFDGFKAVNDLSLTISCGELRFLIGPNGAGKTTVLDVICGRIKPTRGEVIWQGNTVLHHKREHEIARMGISRKFQAPSVFANLTVADNLALAARKNKSVYASIMHEQTIEQKQNITGILEKIGLGHTPHQRAGALSHGQKQWLEIGMLLIQDPRLLLLDEPVAGMTDQETFRTGELLRAIARERAVIVVEHDIKFVGQFATTITVLHEGKQLCHGNFHQVQHNPQVVEVYLGRGKVKNASNM